MKNVLEYPTTGLWRYIQQWAWLPLLFVSVSLIFHSQTCPYMRGDVEVTPIDSVQSRLSRALVQRDSAIAVLQAQAQVARNQADSLHALTGMRRDSVQVIIRNRYRDRAAVFALGDSSLSAVFQRELAAYQKSTRDSSRVP